MAKRGGHRNDPSKEDKLRDKLRKLLAMSGQTIMASAKLRWPKLRSCSAKNKKSWNDLTELMSAGG